MSSPTRGEVNVWICRVSLIELARFFSLTPSLALDFFFAGKFSPRKSMSSCGAFPASELLMTPRATADD